MCSSKTYLIMEAVKQHCTHNRCDLNFIMKWLYTLKAILCILFGLCRDVDLDDEVVHGVARVEKEKVIWHPDPNVHLFKEVAVGKGMGNWFYHIFLDSTPDGEIGVSHNDRIQNVYLSRLRDSGSSSSGPGRTG